MSHLTGVFRGEFYRDSQENACSDNWSSIMHKFTAFLLALGLIIGSGSSAQAAKGNKGNKPKRKPEQVFKKLDKNGDGKLSARELQKKTGKSEASEKIFKRMDKDEDGALTPAEFVSLKRGKKKGKQAVAEPQAAPGENK